MKRKFALLALLCLSSTGIFSQVMGQPGFYGRIEIGNYPEQPPLLFPNAVMGNPGAYTGPPVYMHVPPQQAYYWSSYCGLYGACNWMVYFVQPSWYDQVYVPSFRGGIFYAPPVYVAPPIYFPRPRPNYGGYYHDDRRDYYHRDDHHDRHDDHHAPPPHRDGGDVHHPPPQPHQEGGGHQQHGGDRHDSSNDGHGSRPPGRH